jgi:hypothetical protein
MKGEKHRVMVVTLGSYSYQYSWPYVERSHDNADDKYKIKCCILSFMNMCIESDIVIKLKSWGGRLSNFTK